MSSRNYEIKIDPNLPENGNLITIAEGTIDRTSTSINLLGKNVGDYGQPVAESMVRLLTNFCSSSSPGVKNPNTNLGERTAHLGQLWFNKATNSLMIFSRNPETPNDPNSEGWFKISEGAEATILDGRAASYYLALENATGTVGPTQVGPGLYAINISGNAETATSAGTATNATNATNATLAVTSTKLQTSRTFSLGGVLGVTTPPSFDGTENITMVASFSASGLTELNSRFVNRQGSSMTDGDLTLFRDPSAAMHAATKQYVDTKLSLSGGTMTGNLILNGNATVANGAVTKAQLDAAIADMGNKTVWITYGTAVNGTRVYPPVGRSMADFIAFMPAIREIYYSGDVNGDDWSACRFYAQIDSILVEVFSSEQRAGTVANYIAVWKKSNL